MTPFIGITVVFLNPVKPIGHYDRGYNSIYK